MSAFFEDIQLGETVAIGAHTFTRDEIVAFAERYDPQPFHLDEEAAKESLFGGLCASGWHTVFVWMRLMAAHRARAAEEAAAAGEPAAAYGPSPGFRDLQWLRPVYPGDVVHYSSTPQEKIDLRSRPNHGLLVSRNEGVNQNGEPVIRFLGQLFVERRAPREAAAE